MKPSAIPCHRRRFCIIAICILHFFVAALVCLQIDRQNRELLVSGETCREIGAPGCCDDIRMDTPFFHGDWEKVLNILESLDRPWFASGGWGLFALRIGGYGFKAANGRGHKEWSKIGMDDAMDFTVIYNDAQDQLDKYVEVSALCEKSDGLICVHHPKHRTAKGNGTATIWDSSHRVHFALWGAYMNETDDAVTIVDISGYNYDLPASRILPLKYARFHDSWIRVPRDSMWVYSHLRPWSRENPTSFATDNRDVEYGQGCMKMAYPAFLHQSFGVPLHNPINASSDFYDEIRYTERKLVDCAMCLERHGCASFAPCFRTK